MGNVEGSRESIGDEVEDGISDFEHCFAASLEDFSPGFVSDPLEGYSPSLGPPATVQRGLGNTMNEPLVGRLTVVHMMETDLVLKETVGVTEQTVASIPYAAILRLTWDHSQSSLKVDHLLANNGSGDDISGELPLSNEVFITLRVDNSIELEDELKQRAKAEARRAAEAGHSSNAIPASLYLGMYAGFTKPKPFQRKRPNLSFAVPEGDLPSLKDMRAWSHEEHLGISRPQLYSLRPNMAMDFVFLGGNRFPLSAVEGLALPPPKRSKASCCPLYGELVLRFESVEVKLRAECGKDVTFSYDVIDEWDVLVVPGTGPRATSGFKLWILSTWWRDQGRCFSGLRTKEIDESEGDENNPVTSHRNRCSDRSHIFLGIPEKFLVLARNAMDYFWNRRRAELHLPPRAGSTHGRSVASMVTLQGEVKAPTLPTGRIDPVDLDGVEIRIGQVVQPSPPKRGQFNLLPGPCAILRVEKKRTLRYNARARSQWERVVLHQGWLRKRGGGAIKRWIWRYFVLYDTPQGHFLAYYNDVSEVPLYSENRRERRVVDLCKVCFLRPEISRQNLSASELPPNAFSIVTTERQWTLCADSKAGVLQWLRMISVAIDEDVAVVDDGETQFNVKAHWSPHGGKYGPENAATVHLGSMGMVLRLASLDLTPTKAGFAQTMRIWGSSDRGGALMNCNSNRVRFWSFTDFYKWTIVSLQEGIPGLAIQCFTDDEFDTRESILLVLPEAKQLAIAIEHQVEKFMAVMHLRLETPESMKATTLVYQSGHEGTISIEVSTEKKIEDEAVKSKREKSPTREFPRVSSMNLATDPSDWGGEGMLSPGQSGGQPTAGGGINPFDFSSDDEDDEENSVVGSWGGHHKESNDTLTLETQAATLESNPFDFSFFDNEEEWENGRDAVGGTGEISREVHAHIADASLSGAQSSRARQLFSAGPSLTGLHSTKRDNTWPFEEFPNQHMADKMFPGVFSLPVSTSQNSIMSLVEPTRSLEESRQPFRGIDLLSGIPSEEPPPVPPHMIARDKKLPPKPLLNIDPEGSFAAPTPPVTPLSISPAKEQTLLHYTFKNEAHNKPLPLLPAKAGFVPNLTWPQLSKGVKNSSREQPDFNPFARPASFVIGPPLWQPPLTGKGKVFYDDGFSVRVILDECSKTGRTCSLKLRCQLRISSATIFRVEFVRNSATSGVGTSFDPEIASLELGAEEEAKSKELLIELSVTCLRPFLSPPEIALTTGEQDPPPKTRISLPITVSTFLTGLPMTADKFRQRWTTLSSSGHVVQAVVGSEGQHLHHGAIGARCSQIPSAQPINVRRILVEELGMTEIVWGGKGAVGEVELIAAAGALLASEVVEGVPLVCLVGVELNSNTGAVRATTKSKDEVLAEGVQKDLIEKIRGLAAEGSEYVTSTETEDYGLG